MDVILGIDIGGSTTKIVGLRTDGSVLSMLRVRAEDQVTSLYGALGNYLTSNQLSLRDVRRVVRKYIADSAVRHAKLTSSPAGQIVPTHHADSATCLTTSVARHAAPAHHADSAEVAT